MEVASDDDNLELDMDTSVDMGTTDAEPPPIAVVPAANPQLRESLPAATASTFHTRTLAGVQHNEQSYRRCTYTHGPLVQFPQGAETD